MPKISVNFFEEEISFKPKQLNALRNWINQTILAEKHELSELNFIFCSDKYLLNINQQYLQHDTLTDIITFDNSETKGLIYGDIFISIDRVRENSKTFKTTLATELHRVIIHGTLHLLGYKDKTDKEQTLMTSKEDFYLAARNF